VTPCDGFGKELRVVKKIASKRNQVPVPDGIGALIHLANLLPRSQRVSRGPHEFLMRERANQVLEETPGIDDVDRQNRRMFYLQRYLKDLPLELQGFVLRDDMLRYVDIGDEMTAPQDDAYHRQRLRNLKLLDLSEPQLRQILADSKGRIDVEINLARQRAHGFDGSHSILKRLIESVERKSDNQGDRERIHLGLPSAYDVRGEEYDEMSLPILIDRAKERFVFILAAEELLDALVHPEPATKLNGGLYYREAGAGAPYDYLFSVEHGEIKYEPPLLFSLIKDVDVRRVRRCSVCENYFWAGRSNKKVCSDACGATSRKRAQRKRDLEIKLGDRSSKKKGMVNFHAGKRLSATVRRKGK
jgi:hypothetical protein